MESLVDDFNEFVAYGNGGEGRGEIHPEIMGVVFTMIQVRADEPIASQRRYISQIEKLDVPTFGSWIRENKTKFSNAPEYGVPVVLTQQGSHAGSTYQRIVAEIEDFVTEFEGKLP